MSPGFDRIPHPSPTPGDARAAVLADPGFGRVFTDHMVTVRYAEGRGWHDARIGPREPLSLDPATAVLHYAQEIFEGLKAYRTAGGGVALFRPDANARRFRASAERLAMPPVPEELFLAAVGELVRADREWLPPQDGGALYLRPFMFASEAFLGVRPSREYLFVVIASPVGGYFKGGARAITVWVPDDLTRAAPGGTGAAKCGGNYAAGLLAQREATANGCDQVMFLDAAGRGRIEELGGMNVFAVFDDGVVRTPPLGDTILAGITRDSILTLARDMGIDAREEPHAIGDWLRDAADGRLREAFACGTAAAVTAIGRVKGPGFDVAVADGAPGPVTGRFRAALTDLQRGAAADPHGWLRRVA